jgi:hypothetical protein
MEDDILRVLSMYIDIEVHHNVIQKQLIYYKNKIFELQQVDLEYKKSQLKFKKTYNKYYELGVKNIPDIDVKIEKIRKESEAKYKFD